VTNQLAGPGPNWRSLLEPEPTDECTAQLLVERFAGLEQDRTDLGSLAGARYRSEPGYRWIPYKEAFSPGLVRVILDHWSGLDGPILDQFAGSGTSLLVAAERGIGAVGVEMLPYARWAADTLVRAHRADPGRVLQLVAAAAARAAAHPVQAGPAWPVPAAAWALTEEVAATVQALRAALPPRASCLEADLAHLALVSVIERVSMSVKDGTSVRHRDRNRPGRDTRPGRKGQRCRPAEVVAAFLKAAQAIADDVAKLPGGAEARVVPGDARRLPFGDAAVGGAVFSPPYPNRYDYSAIYQLELAAGGFTEASADLRRIRQSLLCSHLESRPDDQVMLDDPAVISVLRAARAAAGDWPAERGRILRMLVGYFDDMSRVMAELARVLRPGAPAACVVATQTYFGCPVPTDVMLASLAGRAGLVVEELWVLRHKRVAVQQRAQRIASTGGRESVLLMRRPLSGPGAAAGR
jgi:hypothetical protein